MKIAYVLYPDFTGLDLVGPYEVISRWPSTWAIASSPVRAPIASTGSLRANW